MFNIDSCSKILLNINNYFFLFEREKKCQKDTVGSRSEKVLVRFMTVDYLSEGCSPRWSVLFGGLSKGI